MELPPPKSLSHRLSRQSQRTEPSLVKRFYKYFTLPNIGNLAGGLPNPKNFPYDTLEAQVAHPNRFQPTPSTPVQPPSLHKNSKHARIVVPHDSLDPDLNTKIDLATALQYGTAQGYPPLRSWLREFTRSKMHPNVPYSGGPEIILTNGNTDGFAKTLHVFSDVWDDRKDWLRERQGVLCEEVVYMNAIQAMKPRGLNVVTVSMDEQGMLAEGQGGLRDILENWDLRKGRLPHLMYTVPTGQNPASGVLSLGRKKQIYALCQKYDIIIIEDEPYWFLQYPSATSASSNNTSESIEKHSTKSTSSTAASATESKFLDSLVPSYLHIDVDGRVIRLDTFSKTIAPGCRLGWITAQPEVINSIYSYTDLATQQPSGFVQSMVAELVLGQRPMPNQSQEPSSRSRRETENSWGSNGWIRWIEGLRGDYERHMQTMAQILDDGKYKVSTCSDDSVSGGLSVDAEGFEVLSKLEMFHFTFPMGGMFLWLRVQFENRPLFGHPELANEKLSRAFWILLTTEKYRVLVAPGFIFCPTEETILKYGWAWFRLCFAASEDVIVRSSNSFVLCSNDFFNIDDLNEIEEILREDETAIQSNLALSSLYAQGNPMLSPIAY